MTTSHKYDLNGNTATLITDGDLSFKDFFDRIVLLVQKFHRESLINVMLAKNVSPKLTNWRFLKKVPFSKNQI